MKTVIAALLLLTAACSGSSDGAAACVAAGGQCIIGGNTCSNRGSQDCNPDKNPGGAILLSPLSERHPVQRRRDRVRVTRAGTRVHRRLAVRHLVRGRRVAVAICGYLHDGRRGSVRGWRVGGRTGGSGCRRVVAEVAAAHAFRRGRCCSRHCCFRSSLWFSTPRLWCRPGWAVTICADRVRQLPECVVRVGTVHPRRSRGCWAPRLRWRPGSRVSPAG